MSEVDKSLQHNYRGVHHYFCSSQCMTRFKKHPHLFVGDPKYGLSVKQKGSEVIKEQKIQLVNAIDEKTETIIRSNLQSLMGVKEVQFLEQSIVVTYDLIQVSLEDIENSIVMIVGKLNSVITEKIKRGFIHYTEECELENLAHLSKGGKCH
jgi:YHS domain-containing protein